MICMVHKIQELTVHLLADIIYLVNITCFLKFFYIFQGNFDPTSLTPMQVHSSVDCTVSNGFGLNEYERRISEFPLEQVVSGTGDAYVIPLCQRLIAALISEEDCGSGSEDLKVDAYGPEFDLDGELESNSLDHQSLVSFQDAGHAAFNGYRMTGKPENDEPETDMMSIPSKSMNSNFGHSMNCLLSDQALMPNRTCSEFQYGNMQLNEKLLLEIQSIGLYPEPVVGLIFHKNSYAYFVLLLFNSIAAFTSFLLDYFIISFAFCQEWISFFLFFFCKIVFL